MEEEDKEEEDDDEEDDDEEEDVKLMSERCRVSDRLHYRSSMMRK
jgi:NACalpha-BTF3-like transcription factor